MPYIKLPEPLKLDTEKYLYMYVGTYPTGNIGLEFATDNLSPTESLSVTVNTEEALQLNEIALDDNNLSSSVIDTVIDYLIGTINLCSDNIGYAPSGFCLYQKLTIKGTVLHRLNKVIELEYDDPDNIMFDWDDVFIGANYNDSI